MRPGIFLVLGLLMVAACAPVPVTTTTVAPAVPSMTSVVTPTPIPTEAITLPPPGAQRMEGGCGGTTIYKGGTLPSWALVNAPTFLTYVVATPPTVIGYLFTDPMHAGDEIGNKILWYVAGSREDKPLVATAHPLSAAQPTASFTIPANSGPGEIYPSGPKAPSAGCWHFTLTWRGGAERAEVDLLFK
jgi:hypothetical protein